METPTPQDSTIQAEYADGFILDETTLKDTSLYKDGANSFYDVLNKLPEAEHGKMVRFSVFWKNERHDVDWTTLPDNARPIRFRHGFSSLNVGTGETKSGWTGVDFGYQFTDEEGNHQEVRELR